VDLNVNDITIEKPSSATVDENDHGPERDFVFAFHMMCCGRWLYLQASNRIKSILTRVVPDMEFVDFIKVVKKNWLNYDLNIVSKNGCDEP
jgi:hypothetical protein